MLSRLLLECLVSGGVVCAVYSRRLRWLTCGGKQKPLLGIAACAIVLLLASEMVRPTNLYDFLNVTYNSSKSEITSNYKFLLKKFHPDTNHDSGAPLVFLNVKKAYDVIINDSNRVSYNTYGDLLYHGEDAIETFLKRDLESLSMSIYVIILALANGILMYVISSAWTLARRFEKAKQIIIMYQVALFCLEMQLRFVEDPIHLSSSMFGNLPYIGQMLPFEKIQLLRRITPAIMSLAMLWNGYNYVDKTENELLLLKGVLLSQRAILMHLYEDTQSKQTTPNQTVPSVNSLMQNRTTNASAGGQQNPITYEGSPEQTNITGHTRLAENGFSADTVESATQNRRRQLSFQHVLILCGILYYTFRKYEIPTTLLRTVKQWYFGVEY